METGLGMTSDSSGILAQNGEVMVSIMEGQLWRVERFMIQVNCNLPMRAPTILARETNSITLFRLITLIPKGQLTGKSSMNDNPSR